MTTARNIMEDGTASARVDQISARPHMTSTLGRLALACRDRDPDKATSARTQHLRRPVPGLGRQTTENSSRGSGLRTVLCGSQPLAPIALVCARWSNAS